jgi:hypothetical protein
VDEDTSERVAEAVRKLRPAWNVVHVREWAGAATPDAVLLEKLFQDRRVLLSRDRSTLPGWIKERQARGLSHAGVVFWDDEHFRADAVGALARATVKTLERFPDTTDIVATVR